MSETLAVRWRNDASMIKKLCEERKEDGSPCEGCEWHAKGLIQCAEELEAAASPAPSGLEQQLIKLRDNWRGMRGCDWHDEPRAWKVSFNVCADELDALLSRPAEPPRWECTCKGRDQKVWHADDDCPIHGEQAAAPSAEQVLREPLWEVVPGKEADDWGIRKVGETQGASVAQMMWDLDAQHIVELHNALAAQPEAKQEEKS